MWICGTGFLFTIAYIKLISYPIDIQHCFRVNMTGHFTGHTANGSSKISGKPGKGGKRMNTKRIFPFNTNIVINNVDLFCWCLEWTIPFVCCLFRWFSQFFFQKRRNHEAKRRRLAKRPGMPPENVPPDKSGAQRCGHKSCNEFLARGGSGSHAGAWFSPTVILTKGPKVKFLSLNLSMMFHPVQNPARMPQEEV